MRHHSLCNPQTTVQPCLAQKLEEGKKKKKKKKITLDFVAAEMASLVASRGSDEPPTLHPPPQLEEESQRTGATPHRVTEPGMEEHGYFFFCSQAFLPSSFWSLIGTLEAIKNWMMGRPVNGAVICLLPFTCTF